MKDTSRQGFYKDLGLESLSGRRWYHKLFLFYKIVKDIPPSSYSESHLFPHNERTYNTRSS